MLSLANITKVYTTGGESVTALRGVTLHFRRSEFVSILGPSGCGKTTMLNIIGGLDHYTDGDLLIDGISTKQFSDRDWDAYRNHRIGFVFQNYQLIPHQTVLANVELALTLSGVSKAERRRRAVEALTRVGLADQLKKKPNQMSGGQMQRVAIARALVNDPEILLADEPTGALDTKTSEQIMDLLREVAEHRLVIMVTHNPDLAEAYSTRIIRAKDGTIVDDTRPYSAEEEAAEVAELQAAAPEAQVPPVIEITSGEDEKLAPAPGKTPPLPAGEGKATPSGKPGKRAKKKTKVGKADKHTSMSFLTALSLSCNNLLTKKARTILTAFAGSIGIIGIALILSLSNGIQLYIDRVQEDALSSYPLSLEAVTMDMTDVLAAFAGSSDGQDHDDGYVYSSPSVVKMLQAFVGGIRTNDLASFKKYIESDECDIDDPSVATVEYTYGVTPVIYHVYPDGAKGKLVQVSPSNLFGSLMGASSSSSPAGALGFGAFDCLLDNPELLDAQYDVLEGRWPAAMNEVVLVADSHSEINDIYLYALGIKDPDELGEILGQIIGGHGDEIHTEQERMTYDFLMSQTFTLVVAGDLYTPSEEDPDIFEYRGDLSVDEDFVRARLAEADTPESRTVTLHVSGIVKPKKDAAATSVSGVVGYTSALNDYLMQKAGETPVVQAQLKDLDTDPLSGRPYSSISYNALSDESKAQRIRTLLASGGRERDELTADLESLLFYTRFETESQAVRAKVEAVLDLLRDGQDGESAAASVRGYLAATLAHVLADEHTLNNPLLTEYFGTSMTAVIGKGADVVTYFLISLDEGGNFASTFGTSLLDMTVSAMTLLGYRADEADEWEAEDSILPLDVLLAREAEVYDGYSDPDFADAYDELLAGASDGALALLWAARYAVTSPTSLAQNLSDLGIADPDSPSAINIYPVSFEMKDYVTAQINAYNDRMEAEKAAALAAGEEDVPDKEIVYTDYIGVLFSSISLILNIITYVLVAFVAISLVVSSIMIGIITYISVLERTREIGILRAIGASKRDVSRVFNAETVIIGFTAGLMGIVATLILIFPINAIIRALAGVSNIGAKLPWAGGIALVLISMGLTLVAGLLPARIAAKKDPVEALRTE